MSSQILGEKALYQAMRNLPKVYKKAGAKAINNIAKKAMKQATKAVAKEIGVKVKTIRGRARLAQKPTAANPKGVIRLNRSLMPLIRVTETKRNRISASKGVLKVGKHRIKRGFVQTLHNRRTHIMFRQGKARYGIDVAKIPLSTPLTTAFHRELADYPNQLKKELVKHLSHSLKGK